jgi:DNA-directed RNA polymerase specialized sigma24 family protein
VLEGERTVALPDGRFAPRRANLGESPIAWLLRRRDARGRPWLTPAEAAAAARLRDDHERCAVLGRLTMDWSGMPRSGAGWSGVDPAERDRAAKQRVVDALASAGPGLREVLEQVVLRGSALEAAERVLDLPRRSGKTLLKLALHRLVEHYGMNEGG